MEEEPVAKKRLKTEDPSDFVHPKNAADLCLNLLKSQEDCDVFFLVGSERKRVGAHKLILRRRSPVFATMFSERWGSKNGNKEEKQESSNEIELEEDEPSVFWLFLEYVYSDIFTGGTVEAVKLLHLAHYYDVKPLSKLCEELLLNKFEIDNVLEIFSTAQKYSLSCLMTQAGDLMTSQFEELANSPTFHKADEATLVYLLRRDDLAIEESKLFSVLLGWADKQIESSTEEPKPERAEILKNLIPLVRFPTMTAKEFGSVVVPTKILPPETTIDLFTFLTANEEKRNVLGSSLPFSKTPRTGTLSDCVDVELYTNAVNPRTHCRGSWLKKVSNIRDVLMFRYCESPKLLEKNLKVRIVSLLLQPPKYSQPLFQNSAQVAGMKLSIRVALSLTLVPGSSYSCSSNPQLQAHEEVIAIIRPDKTEVVMLDNPYKPWELVNNNSYKITVRFLSEIYAVPGPSNGSHYVTQRDENFDVFSDTALQTQIVETKPFGTVTFSNLAMSCATGPAADPFLTHEYYVGGSANAISSGLHLIRSMKIAFA